MIKHYKQANKQQFWHLDCIINSVESDSMNPACPSANAHRETIAISGTNQNTDEALKGLLNVSIVS